MTTDSSDETTALLATRAAITRSRIASDIEKLSEQLTPAEVKDRALDAAERSVERLAARGLRRLVHAPRWLLAYLRAHPAASFAAAAGAGFVIWRLASRRQR